MLVVDSTGSINSVNFDTLIQFVVQVTRQFVIAPESTRVGLIQFSEQSDLEIGLGNITNDGELERAIKNVLHQNGGKTNTGAAIRQAINQLFNSPRASDDVSKLMFLFTVGAPTNSSDAENAGINARNLDIQITAIGINIAHGSRAEDHLELITGSEDRLLLVEEFDEKQLNETLAEFMAQSCPSM